MTIRLFENESHIHTRALQIYLVLIGLAWNKKIITYGKLSTEQMGGYGKGQVILSELGQIRTWCAANNLPDLSALVINQETGIPGHMTAEEAQAVQGKVYARNWFDFFPPNVSELQASSNS